MFLTNQRGLSLYQGMISLAVLSMVFLSAAPLCYRMLADRHVVAYTNELVGTLQQARHLAVKTSSPVSLCSSNNGRVCTHTPWSQGYIAFYDAGQPGLVDENDRIVRAVQSRTAPVRVVLSGARHIRFLQSGGVLADATSSGYHLPSRYPEQPAFLASLLNALSPVSTASAAVPAGATDDVSTATEQPVAFLVCSGKAGRAIRVTAIGRLDTSTVACR